MKHTFLIICIALSTLSCNKSTEETKATGKGEVAAIAASQIVGDWINLDVTIDFNFGDTTAEGQAAPTMVVDSLQWEAKLGLKPIVTNFRADSTWTSTYRNLQDAIVNQTGGSWWLVGDTMIFKPEIPAPAPEERLHVKYEDGMIHFSGLVDFDQDGQIDDLYIGRQRRTGASN